MIHNQCGLCRVEIKDLCVRSGKDVLIENIHLELHCGELTALIGKNGAGKTTLLKALLGERSYTGRITYYSHNGQAVNRPKIGYVPQQLSFDRSTPVSVSDFLLAAHSTRPVWFSKRQKETEFITSLLSKVHGAELMEKRLGDLSGGELQRILLAMAIDPMPDLLVLDEPVSGIDAPGLDMFYHMALQLRDQSHIAIVLVSHDLPLIRKYADKAILLDKTIIAQGEVNEVFQTTAFRQAFSPLE